VSELKNISKSKYIKNIEARAKRAEEHSSQMHKNQYKVMFRWIINDIERAISERKSMTDRFNKYIGAKRA
jgi:anion-transporting  ArsA/GET3 family ATPase